NPLHETHAVENSVAFFGKSAQKQPLDRSWIRRTSVHPLFDYFAAAVHLPRWPGWSREVRSHLSVVIRIRIKGRGGRDENPRVSVPMVDLNSNGKHMKHNLVIRFHSD